MSAIVGGPGRFVDVCCRVVLAAFIVWSIAGEAIRTGGLGDEALDDYAIARTRSLEIVERADYGWQLDGDAPVVVFAYPPPYVLLHVALAAAGPWLGPLAYMLGLLAAFYAIARVGMRLSGADRWPLRWLAVLLAVAACRVFVQADLHFLNSNLLTVALAMGALAAFGPGPRGAVHDAMGGMLLAASLAIKPWAAGVPLALLVLGRGRAVAWTLLCGALLFVLLPVATVGLDDTISLTTSYVALLPATLDTPSIQRIAVDQVSLAAAGSALGLAGAPLEIVTRGLQLLWLFGVVAAVGPVLRDGTRGRPMDAKTWLRVGATSFVALVPLGAMFQPHHAVAVLPIAICVSTDVVAPLAPRRGRLIGLAVLGGVFAISTYGPGGALRGYGFLACLALLVGTAWWRPGMRVDSAGQRHSADDDWDASAGPG